MGILASHAEIQAGKAQAAEYRSEADLMERQAQDVDLQALQSSAARRENLRSSIAAIEARRVSSGLSLDSPSAMAIEREVRRQAVKGEQIEKVGFGNQKYSLRYGAAAKRTSASNAKTSGWLKGLISFGKSAENAAAAGG